MTKVTCDNCEWTGDEESLGEEDEDGELYGRTLHQIHHLADRLDPGGVVPAGECPECGALAYLDDPAG
jgi:hypothetical protein